MPKTYFEMAPDQGKTTIYVTWRDKRGEQAEVFPINFDPNAALAGEQKATLEQFWTNWIALREFQGMKVYFTHLITYRCAIKEVRYGYNGGAADKVFKLPDCDPADPHSVPGQGVHECAGEDSFDVGATHLCGRKPVGAQDIQRAEIAAAVPFSC